MFKIRSFNKKDRFILRQICCDAADRGEAIENFFPDREFAADLLMNYYTDYEPENTLVAEADGQVVAYINASLDNRRYGLVLIFIIVPLVLIKGIFRGVYLRREFWQIVRAMLMNWHRLFHFRKKSFDSHQGHLHIGVAKKYRNQHIGGALLQALFDQAKNKGITQITASVNDANLAACRFFERQEFKLLEKYPMLMAYQGKLQTYHSMIYAKELV